MHTLRTFLFGIISVSIGWASELHDQPNDAPEIKIWGKGSGSGSSRRETQLDDFSAKDLKKTVDLDAPVKIEVLSLGRSVIGLEDIKDRIIDVRITNPNSYPIFFQGRQYKENITIKPGWNTLKNGTWTEAGWDWCGTGIRDWNIEPKGSVDVMLYLHPELKEQQILGRFYKTGKPSVQSVCLLFEKK